MQYWLLKSEPDVWSIDQQKKAGVKGAPWDGVRNYQAAKNVSLDEIKKNKDLSHLSLIKQSRLSVMPIDSKSWKLLNKMSKY